ncbi:hypothetical protein C0J52_05788 [Blattella germanica]|nr:hypothetical protein C0J52_05788 [Blattella germanica]
MDLTKWLPTAAKATGVSQACKDHLVKTFDHLITLSPWALKMIDSTSKIPESVMDGNIIDFGNYEECIDIDVNEKWGSFLGQHCIAMTPVLPLGVSFCSPNTCSPSDLQSGLSLFFSNLTVIDPLLCHTKESIPLSGTEWFTIRNFHYKHGHKKDLSLKTSTTSNAWPCIKNVEYLILTNAPFAVDTFFIISGLLLTYIFMKTMDAGYRFSLPAYYLHRIFRVTPALALIVLINATLLPRLSSGPIWDYAISKTEGKYCSEYWWSTLLYIQNYVNTQENCVLTSWFLAVDMQMYFLSPIFLLTLYKRPKIGYLLLGGAGVIGILSSFIQSYVHEDDPNNTKPNIRFSSSYYYTHTRFISWIMGVAGGYLMYRTIDWRNKVKSGTEKFPMTYLACGWVLFTFSSLGIIFSLYPFQQEDYSYSAVEAAFYFALTRPLWSLCVLWLIFACESGCGGLVNRFLTWPGFIPLAHLAFCIYLIHFDVIITQIFSAKVPAFSDDFHVGGRCLDVLFISALGAIILSLSIEAPCIAFIKLIFSKVTQPLEQNGVTLQTVTLEATKKQEPLNSSLVSPS